MKAKKILCVLVALFGLALWQGHAQLVINIRYTGQDGNARKYVRAIEGCLGYDFYFPADDPEGLLLIDSWQNQEALNRYHDAPAMQEAAALREKYGLGGRTVRMFTPIIPGWRQEPPERKQ